MGIFKDFKDMASVAYGDDLKELKRTAGSAPKTSMKDSVKLANQAMGQAQAWQAQAAANPMAAYSTGTPGTATVQAVAETGTQINGAPVLEMDMLVTVPGQAPYPVKHSQMVAMVQIPYFQPGASFPVHVDQADPSKIAIG
jgi:hypothetical protein